jgi:hypothetical protein
MADMDYLDFDLQIERAGQGYRAHVLASPAGQAASDFALPFSDLELENFVLRMSRTHRGTRRMGTPELEAARTFGGRLFEAVFAGEVRGCLRSSLDAASEEGRGLRLRLHLTETPELVDLPWEYLYSPALNRFFALSNATPLVRYLDLPERVSPLTVQPPLRLLAMIASPRDYPALDVEQEWTKLRSALHDLENAGLVVLERLEPPSLSTLQRRLRAGPCHILHFVGHGVFDETTQDGVLLLEDQDGRGRAVSAQDLGVLLHDHPSMRLVVLNSCEGARTSRTDPFAGSAQSLVQQGMPAVVAMQFEISDEAAIVIGHEFYTALAGGYPVDAALAEARKAAFTGDNSAEWGTPVLYLRATDGRIFGVRPPAPSLQPTPPPAIPQAAAAPAPTPEPVTVVSQEKAHKPPSRTVFPRPAASHEATAMRRLVAARGFRLALASVVTVAALVWGLSRLLPTVLKTPERGATGAGGSPVPAAQMSTQAPLTTPRPIDQLVVNTPRVWTSTAWVHDLIPADDGVWAATSGGLVRWKADGTSKVFTAADGLPFNHTFALLTMPDGSIWAAGNYVAVHLNPTGDTLGQIQRYSEAEGFSLGETPVFMLDNDGSVWIGSQYAQQPVQRFNGSVWRPPALPTDDPALQNIKPNISALLRARDGALWVGLNGDGILRWDGKTWTHFAAEQGVSTEAITRLLEDRAGVLWAAAGDGGLLRFEPTPGRWQKIELQRADAPVYGISQLADGSLWASGDNFIVKSTDGGQHWDPVAAPEDNLRYATIVVQDGAGHIWAATSSGVGMYDGQQWRHWQRQGEPAGYALAQLTTAPDGKLWVLPEYGGTPSVIDPATGQVTAPPAWPQDGPTVISLAFTRDTVWAGTTEGLLQLKGGTQRLLTHADGLPDDQASALTAASDTLWIGTHAGLATLDLNSGRVTGSIPAVAGHYVDALATAADGAVWVGSHWGESGANAAVERFAGTQHQIWPLNQPPLDAAGTWPHAFATDDQGNIWLALNNGTLRWDGQKWVGWGSAQGGPRYDVYTLLPHDGAMWAAGHSSGIDRWDGKNGWQHFRPKGLTGDVLSMQMSGDGALWLATTDGLLRYGP